jgi:uncharacterized glyoxalase superfamily protein PhnB
MVTLVVPDMDDAVGHYTEDWGFSLIDNDLHASGHRWVEVGVHGGMRLRLAEAVDDRQRAVIGCQAGGRVAFFLRSSTFDADVTQLRSRGISVVEEERIEAYGRIVVLADKYGNRWDLIETQEGGSQ